MILEILAAASVVVYTAIRTVHHYNNSKESEESDSSSSLAENEAKESPETTETEGDVDTAETEQPVKVVTGADNYVKGVFEASFRDPEFDDDRTSQYFEPSLSGIPGIHVRFKEGDEERLPRIQVLCEIPKHAYMKGFNRDLKKNLPDFMDLQNPAARYDFRMFQTAFLGRKKKDAPREDPELLSDIKSCLSEDYDTSHLYFREEGYYYILTKVNEQNDRVVDIYRALGPSEYKNIWKGNYKGSGFSEYLTNIYELLARGNDAKIRDSFAELDNPELKKLSKFRQVYEPMLEDVMLCFSIEFEVQTEENMSGVTPEQFFEILKVLREYKFVDFKDEDKIFQYKNMLMYVPEKDKGSEIKVYCWKNTGPARFKMSTVNMYDSAPEKGEEKQS